MERRAFILATAPHGPLRGDVTLPEHPRGAPVVVACHGFKGFKDWGFWPETGRRLAEGGLAVVAFNFSGSGIGEDPETLSELDRFEANTIGKELDDLGTILDAVNSREIPLGGADARRLGVLGHSRGGGVALLRASRDPRIHSLATWSAVSTFARYDDAQRELWRDQGYLELENQRTKQILRVGIGFLEDLEAHGELYEPLAAARRIRVPTLILHGSQDETIPVEEARLLSRAIGPGKGELLVLQGTGHTFGAVHPFQGTTPAFEAALERTADWYTRTL